MASLQLKLGRFGNDPPADSFQVKLGYFCSLTTMAKLEDHRKTFAYEGGLQNMHILLIAWIMATPADQGHWTFLETDIFTPIRADSVTVSDQGETFLLDTKECQILKINAQGELVKRFGKKGKGPGEFQFPGNIRAFKDRIFLLDMMSQSLLCFDTDGNFVTSWKTTGFRQDMAKIEGGWVFGKWGNSFDAGESGTLSWVNDDLGETRILHDFNKGKTSEEEAGGFNLEIKDGYATIPFNPAPDRPRLVGLPDGQSFVLFYPGSQLKADLYDAATGKITKQIAESSKAISFNKGWGEELVTKLNKRAEESKQSSGFKTKMNPNFPEFFPYVREAWGHADGKVYVIPWTANPQIPAAVRTLDPAGNLAESDLSSEVVNRLLYLTDTHGWIATFDTEEDMAGIAKVARANLAEFVKANPVKEAEAGAVVMVMQ